MNINPGELDKRIIIARADRSEDSDGYGPENYTPVHKCWARFTRTSATEVYRANADFTVVEARFLIRYTRKKIDRKMVVHYKGDVYQIKYVNNYGDRKEWIEIWTELTTQAAAI